MQNDNVKLKINFRGTKTLILSGVLIVAALSFFFALSEEAQASANHTVSITAATVPCTKTGTSCLADSSASVGTATFDIDVGNDGTDNADSVFFLEFGASTAQGTNDATTAIPQNTCGGGDPMVLTPTTATTPADITDNTSSCGPPAWDDTNKWIDWDSAGGSCGTDDSFTVTWEIEFCDAAAGNTYDIHMDCTAAGGAVKCLVAASIPYIDQWTVAAATPPSLEQVNWKFFSNRGSTTPGSPGASGAPITAPPQGTPFRLRLLLLSHDAQLDANATTVALQVARKVGEICEPEDGADETWSNVASTSGDIRYANVAGVDDGDLLTLHQRDPGEPDGSGSTVTLVDQAYSEGFTTNPQALPQDQVGLWDWALVDVSAPQSTTYCLRAVQIEQTGADAGTAYALSGGFNAGGYATQTLPEFTTAQVMKIRLTGNIRLRIVRLGGG